MEIIQSYDNPSVQNSTNDHFECIKMNFEGLCWLINGKEEIVRLVSVPMAVCHTGGGGGSAPVSQKDTWGRGV